MVLKINDIDYSNRIIAGSYDVNSEDVYKSWTDADGLEHRQFTRARIGGSFDMWVKDPTEYTTFVGALKTAKRKGLTYKIELDVNNTCEHVESNFFLEFAPVRNRDGRWRDYMERYTVTIKEQ